MFEIINQQIKLALNDHLCHKTVLILMSIIPILCPLSKRKLTLAVFFIVLYALVVEYNITKEK
jgi:hypothetical protein